VVSGLYHRGMTLKPHLHKATHVRTLPAIGHYLQASISPTEFRAHLTVDTQERIDVPRTLINFPVILLIQTGKLTWGHSFTWGYRTPTTPTAALLLYLFYLVFITVLIIKVSEILNPFFYFFRADFPADHTPPGWWDFPLNDLAL
jgi:hypothetical protein